MRKSLITQTFKPIRFVDLIFPTAPPDTFKGFPVCEATVQTWKGYSPIYGWTQLWKSSKQPEGVYGWPPAQDRLDWPSASLGVEPRLFDGPMRIGAAELDWTARKFSTYTDGSVISRGVRAVIGL